MSDEIVPEVRPASDEPLAIARPEQGEGGPAPAGGGEEGVTVRKRRRRGSRGGRNRRRPSSAGPGSVDTAGDADGDDDHDDSEGPDEEGGGDAVDLTEKTGRSPARSGRTRQTGSRAAPAADAGADADGAEPSTGPVELSLPDRPGPEAAADKASAGSGGEKAAGKAETTTAPAADGADSAERPSGGRSRQSSGSSRGRARAAAASASAALEISAPAAAPAADGSSPAAGDGDGAAPGATSTRRRRRRGRGSGGSGGGAAAAAGAAGAQAPSAPSRSRGRGAAATAEKARQSEVEAMLDELDEAALERRRGRTRKGRPTGRYLMCVSVKAGVASLVAVHEGRRLVKHYVPRPTDTPTQLDGNIYLGKVQNVLP